MSKVDLHVHSKFSNHPSEWFLQKIGANESYTEPDYIYKMAKAAGMDFVTITDHNKIDGAMYCAEKYPDAFSGVEVTSYFPEDNCKIHILIYGFSREQYNTIEQLRKNIYLLREYLVEQELAHSVAHATYPVNNKLSVEHIEKLILLFDNFEVINGGRNFSSNSAWEQLLRNLRPHKMSELIDKHNINPQTANSWIKGFTGGSDDHAGIFIAKTYTECELPNNSIEKFLQALKQRKTIANGRHNDFQSLAFTIYKIAYDFSKTKSNNKFAESIIGKTSQIIFEQTEPKLLDKYRFNRLTSKASNIDDRIFAAFGKLIEFLRENPCNDTELKLTAVYDCVSDISDEFLRKVLNSTRDDLDNGNFAALVTNISSAIPGIFLTLPFFSTFSHMYSSRDITEKLTQTFELPNTTSQQHILWFTDTFNDLNGVSIMLQRMAIKAHEKNYSLKIVCSLDPNENAEKLPQNVINLPFLYTFDLPGYEKYSIRIPSFLASLKMLYEHPCTKIYISTPGPVGLLGLLCAHLTGIKANGVFHTDFKMQIAQIIEDEQISDLAEVYTQWFYNLCSQIHVPSNEYISLLQERNYDSRKLRLFKRGIETELFAPQTQRSELQSALPEQGIRLLYTGRISKDKNLDFLLEVFGAVCEKYGDINLIIAGDGPYLSEFEKKVRNYTNIILLGALKWEKLPELYSSCDIFLFPSTTDTFGMSVLEAQSCALPAIVSKAVGPQEIVIDKQTGFVVGCEKIEYWVQTIEYMVSIINSSDEQYFAMRRNARQHIEMNYSWSKVLAELFAPRHLALPA